MNTADNELSFNDLPKAVTRILSDVAADKTVVETVLGPYMPEFTCGSRGKSCKYDN